MTKRPFSRYSDVTDSVESAFQYHVHPEPNSGCWLWVGPIFHKRGGYGCFTMRPANIIQMRAHRLSWEIYRGAIPDGMHVCHKCDNPCCVNPKHLFLGYQSHNMDDKVSKSRQNKGNTHGRRKLNEIDVYAIREDSRPLTDIADEYGISCSTVSSIRNRKTWTHLNQSRAA